MDELLRLSAVLAAGGCAGLAVLAAGAEVGEAGAREWLRRRARGAPGSRAVRVLASLPRPPAAEAVRGRLRDLLEQADWRETPEQFVAGLGLATAAVAAASALAATMVSSALSAAPAGMMVMVAVPILTLHRLIDAGRVRRTRLRAELAPLLELVTLELSGGASPAAAFESVLFKSDCELAATLRRELILSRVAGSASFETRVTELAARCRLESLDSLAMVLSLSRDYGSGVGQGLKALAADLRRVQRRELIASSRRALNRVLLPAAIGVLLPFMAILLFPALATLWSSFQ